MSVLPPCEELDYRTYQSRLLLWAKRPGDAGNLLAQDLREANREPDLASWFGPGDPVFALSHVPDWNQWLPRAVRTQLGYFANPI